MPEREAVGPRQRAKMASRPADEDLLNGDDSWDTRQVPDQIDSSPNIWTQEGGRKGARSGWLSDRGFNAVEEFKSWCDICKKLLNTRKAPHDSPSLPGRLRLNNEDQGGSWKGWRDDAVCEG